MKQDNFFSRREGIIRRIAEACQACGRSPCEVEILPVTKFHPVDAVILAAESGFTAVGENRVQELVEKKTLATAKGILNLRWELIGHLQSNKAKLAATHADRIQSVDSVKLLHKLDQLANEIERPLLPVLLQINAGDDPAKHGADLSDAAELLETALNLPRLRVDGLMTVAPLYDDPAATAEAARECFDNLRNLRDALQTAFAISLPVLSMGMTSDLEAAIRAGSTQVRIGTALFGERQY